MVYTTYTLLRFSRLLSNATLLTGFKFWFLKEGAVEKSQNVWVDRERRSNALFFFLSPSFSSPIQKAQLRKLKVHSFKYLRVRLI